jgi:formate hydrogenlyase transcriptional activator
MLFRAIVFYPTAPIVLTDNDRRYREASIGATKLLGLPREKIIGHKLDDFAHPDFKPVISKRWKTCLEEGEQVGTIPLVDATGNLREVEYVAKGNVLPVRHILVLSDTAAKTSVPASVQDYALFLLDVEGGSSLGMPEPNAFTGTLVMRLSAKTQRSFIHMKTLL